MRILAIRGENLASLAEPFAIEFEREPLRSAGLFAITGETGAGKSTILDALCLALYDEFPRVVAAGGSDEVPDVAGDSIKEDDPRTILRRGAARGFAEVDFVGRDGGRYRARCDILRARGRVAGRLQKRARSLWRIEERGNILETLESGVETVNRRIVQLTDLTFDQFRRTALLAQGDFDAFLRAKVNERGDLLEKITGAEIYSRLSVRAYEKARQAREGVERLEASLREIGVMTQDARDALVAQCDAIETQRIALAATHRESVERLRRLDAHAAAQAKFEQAESDRAAAETAVAALADKQRLLDDLARVAPLRGPRDAALKAEAALAAHVAVAAQAAAAAEAADNGLAAARENERVALQAQDAAAREIDRFAPIWAQANALDVRIDTQAREAETARGAEESATRRAQEKRAELAETRAAGQRLAAQQEGFQQRFDALAAARPLSERWQEIDDWLTKRGQFLRAMREDGQALRHAEEALSRAAAARADFDRADAADQAALASALAQVETRAAVRLALDAPAAQRRLDDILRAQQVLQALTQDARAYDLAQAKAAQAAADAARFGDEAAAIAGRLAALRATRAAQAADKDEAERLGELADAAAAPHALQLRAALEDGAPCPVCGATAHPFAVTDGAAQALVDALRVKRDAARRALRVTEKAIVDDSALAAAAEAQAREAAQRLAESRLAMETAAQDYAKRRAQAPDIESATDIADAEENCGMRLVALEEERAVARRTLDRDGLLASEIAALQRTIEAKRAAIEERRVARDEMAVSAGRAGEDRARLLQALASGRERIDSIDRALASFLIVADLTTGDLDRDPDGARGRLADAGASYAGARDAFENATREREALAPRIAALAADDQSATEAANAAAANHVARRAALARLQAERGDLLDGESVATHRARAEDAQKAARLALEAARASVAECDKAKAACDARTSGALQDVETSRSACDATRAAYVAALASTGLAEADAFLLLDIPAQEADACRHAIVAAQTRRVEAERAALERRRDLHEFESTDLTETQREALVASVAESTTTLDRLLGEVVVLRERLAQDDAARCRAAALSGDIEAASAARKIWDEINEAIGSREGDKFRRFAQSVTLAQLVALANARLALLSPRYRLERAGGPGSLGLQIIDRDLGDERRSTRSLSGGERFLASLALALALAGLEGRDSFVDTLFIDEGFGALDAATLDVAIDALENLQGQGRKVGVISHVEALQSRIATKISVERRGGGVSAVRLRAPGFET